MFFTYLGTNKHVPQNVIHQRTLGIGSEPFFLQEKCLSWRRILKYFKVHVTVYQVENANVSTILMHITYRFLKRAPHEGANLLSIDTVPCDGHQMTSTRHDVTKQSQVTVIDIRAIKWDDMIHLTLYCLSHCLYPKNLQQHSVESVLKHILWGSRHASGFLRIMPAFFRALFQH